MPTRHSPSLGLIESVILPCIALCLVLRWLAICRLLAVSLLAVSLLRAVCLLLAVGLLLAVCRLLAVRLLTVCLAVAGLLAIRGSVGLLRLPEAVRTALAIGPWALEARVDRCGLTGSCGLVSVCLASLAIPRPYSSQLVTDFYTARLGSRPELLRRIWSLCSLHRNRRVVKVPPCAVDLFVYLARLCSPDSSRPFLAHRKLSRGKFRRRSPFVFGSLG